MSMHVHRTDWILVNSMYGSNAPRVASGQITCEMWQIRLFICLFIQAFRCWFFFMSAVDSDWVKTKKENSQQQQQQQHGELKLNKKQKCSFCVWPFCVCGFLRLGAQHFFLDASQTSGLWLWLIRNLLLTSCVDCVVLWMNLMPVFNLKTAIGGIVKFAWCLLAC